jgi:hypothetical protein
MTRMARQALERKLEQARRLALEPTDLRAREQVAQLIEELELRLQDGLLDNHSSWEPRHAHYTGIILN